MKKTRILGLGLLAMGMLFTGCNDQLIESSPEAEAFLQGFIRDFGIPAEGHTFSMAAPGRVTVRTSTPTDVKVVAKVAGRRYLFAEWDAITDGQTINFDIPRDAVDVMLLTNERGYLIPTSGVVDLDADATNNAPASRLEDGAFDPNNSRYTIYAVPDLRDDNTVANRANGVIGVNSTADIVCDPEDATDKFTYTSGINVDMLSQHLRQLVSTGMTHSGGQEFYEKSLHRHSTDPKAKRFTPTTLLNTTISPGVYIKYMRRPDGKNYKFGVMIGDGAALASSSKIYKMPIFDTSLMQSGTFGKRVGTHLTDMDYLGAETTFDFNNNTFDVRPTSTMSNMYCPMNITPTDAFKQQIQDMAYLFANGVLKTSEQMKAGDTDPSNPLPAWTAGDEFSYYKAYDLWLRKKCEALKSDPTYGSKVHDLKDVKGMLSYKGGNFDRVDEPANSTPGYSVEYPEVIETSPNVYTIRYHMSSGSCAEAGTSTRVGVNNGDSQRNSFFEPEADDLLMYQGLCAFPKFPKELQGNEWCYYVEKADGTYVTTADKDAVMYTNDIYYEDTDMYNYDSYLMDINGDKIFDDIVFKSEVVGGGPNTGYNKYRWIMACEDLGSNASSDTDYNDIVFSLSFVSGSSSIHESVVDIKALAAGGIYPAYVMITDNNDNSMGFVGPEIHSWLNQNKVDIYNTDVETSLTGSEGVNSIRYRYDILQHGGQPFSLQEVLGTQSFTNLGVTFWVLVDKNDELEANGLAPAKNSREITWHAADSEAYQAINALNINKVNYPINNLGSNASVPVIICVGSDWEWPLETVSLKQAYPHFIDWVADPTVKWYGLDKNGYLLDVYNRDKVVKHLTPVERPATGD